MQLVLQLNTIKGGPKLSNHCTAVCSSKMVIWEDGSRQIAVDVVVGKQGMVGTMPYLISFVLGEQWQFCLFSKLASRLMVRYYDSKVRYVVRVSETSPATPRSFVRTDRAKRAGSCKTNGFFSQFSHQHLSSTSASFQYWS